MLLGCLSCLWPSIEGVSGGVKAGLTNGGGAFEPSFGLSFNSETDRSRCRGFGEATGVKAGDAWAGKSGIIVVMCRSDCRRSVRSSKSDDVPGIRSRGRVAGPESGSSLTPLSNYCAIRLDNVRSR